MAELNRRLTQADASFLYVDRPNQPMHGASVGVYEGHLSLEDVIRIMDARMHLLPRYRQRVVYPPFGIAHPTWEDDPAFDIRTHIVEETLPTPGDERVLATAVGRLMAPQLDFTKPLWKMVVLQGRADGNTAIVSMVHHAMIDGVSGVDVMLVMHDLTPDAEPPAPPATPWQPKPLPEPLDLLQEAVRDQLVEAAARWTDDTFNQFRPTEALARAQQISAAMASAMPATQQLPPRTPFNGTVSRERAISWALFSFTEVRLIRSTLGGTINDVVLAVIAGALGRYLHAHNYPTQGVELRSMCPVSMRRPDGRGALGNQVSMMMAPLYVGISDPVERLQAERAAMERLKQADQAGGFYALTQQPTQIPPYLQYWAGQQETPNTLLHTVTTNVPGPQIPLYLDGHQLLESYGGGMLSANIGLFHATTSYNQTLAIGATVDPQQMADPWFYADCLKESFAELRAAAEQKAGVSATPVARPAPAARRSRAAKQPAAAQRR